MLSEERLRSERHKALRDVAEIERDDAVSDLAHAYSDIDSMRASLTDSAMYVRYLKQKIVDLEVTQAKQAARPQVSSGGLGHGCMFLAV